MLEPKFFFKLYLGFSEKDTDHYAQTTLTNVHSSFYNWEEHNLGK